ncbi:hypothetical protein HDU99_010181, partial [Rhizoclosmatium hyalinum]
MDGSIVWYLDRTCAVFGNVASLESVFAAAATLKRRGPSWRADIELRFDMRME